MFSSLIRHHKRNGGVNCCKLKTDFDRYLYTFCVCHLINVILPFGLMLACGLCKWKKIYRISYYGALSGNSVMQHANTQAIQVWNECNLNRIKRDIRCYSLKAHLLTWFPLNAFAELVQIQFIRISILNLVPSSDLSMIPRSQNFSYRDASRFSLCIYNIHSTE